MNAATDHGDTDRHVKFAGSLARWIEHAGVSDSEARADLAVGMADILHASAHAAAELEELLTLDPTTRAGAEAAAEKLGYLRTLFLTEILDHVRDLEARWDRLEEPIYARVPNDE